ncbi:MAG TPA: response regulator transcription factor [Micavibrio sp.]|jgi:DNA-binding NarL/FixJ family response regulator
MKLLLADDHSLFRDALVEYIERTESGSSVLLARDVHEVMDIMGGKPDVDLILLDLRMPGMNGLQGLEKLRARYPDTPVALISGLAEKHDVEKALELGAAGYFPKTMSGKALLSGIRQILAGEEFVARDHNTNEIMSSHYPADPLQEKNGKGTNGPHTRGEEFRLTPREKEVLTYLQRGESNKEIARALDLQVVTIKLHVRSICRKMGVENRTQAALIAQKQGL